MKKQQNPFPERAGRIQNMEPSILDSNIPMVQITKMDPFLDLPLALGSRPRASTTRSWATRILFFKVPKPRSLLVDGRWGQGMSTWTHVVRLSL